MKQVITALLATMYISYLGGNFPLWATITITIVYMLLSWFFSSKTFKHHFEMSKANQELKRKNRVSEQAIKDAVIINKKRLAEEIERQAELIRKKVIF